MYIIYNKLKHIILYSMYVNYIRKGVISNITATTSDGYVISGSSET